MSKIESKIDVSDVVENKERRFGAALEYYPAYLVGIGEDTPLLFTKSQIEVARKRATKNQEDMPAEASWIDWLLG